MEDLPLVSVITPSLNQGQFIEEMILSVKGQDYPRLEHLVIDGGSTDATLEILRRYDHLAWVSEPDCGQADAVNKGFRLAKGEILGWLNSDDLYAPGAIGLVVDHFSAHPDVDIVYGDCSEVDESGHVRRTVTAHPVDLKRLLLLDFTLYQPTFFFRRRAIDRIGPLSVGLYLGLDYDYVVRAARTCALAYLPATLAAFRTHSNSKTFTHPGNFLQDYLTVFGMVFSDPTLPIKLARLRRRAYSNAYLCGGEQSFGAGRLSEARGRLLKALSLYPHPLRPRSIKAALLLLDLLLGVGLGRRLIVLLGRVKRRLLVQRQTRDLGRTPRPRER